MPCCYESGPDSGRNWCQDLETVYTDAEGKDYCVFHAPQGKKGVSLEEFNKLIFARIREAHEQDKSCHFSGTIFEGNINFSQFDEDNPLPEINFSKARFSGNVTLVRSKFSGHANFCRAQFSGKTNFRHTQFSEYAAFEGAQFNGYADFVDVLFNWGALFDSAQFNEHTDFWGGEFRGRASFYNVRFCGNTNFNGVRFSGDVNFYSAQFSGDADFASAQFNGDAAFADAQFNGDATFVDAQFNGDADFRVARLSGNAAFWNTQFTEDVTFASAQFNGDAAFVDALFNEHAVFVKAQFSREANFAGAQFSEETHFDYIRILGKGQLFFRDIVKTKTFEGEACFRGLDIEGQLIFEGVDLSMASFTDTRVQKIDFVNPRWHRSGSRGWRNTLYDEIALFDGMKRGPSRDGEKPKTLYTDFKNRMERTFFYKEKYGDEIRKVEILYRRMKNKYRTLQNWPEVSNWHYGEKEMLRKENAVRRYFPFSFSFLYWLSSGYGERYVRAGVSLAVLILLLSFGLAWAGLDAAALSGSNPGDFHGIGSIRLGTLDPKSIGALLMNTLKYATFQKDVFFVPRNMWGECLRLIAQILIPIQTALFILAVRNRFRR